jgi:hypothetical protein
MRGVARGRGQKTSSTTKTRRLLRPGRRRRTRGLVTPSPIGLAPPHMTGYFSSDFSLLFLLFFNAPNRQCKAVYSLAPGILQRCHARPLLTCDIEARRETQGSIRAGRVYDGYSGGVRGIVHSRDTDYRYNGYKSHGPERQQHRSKTERLAMHPSSLQAIFIPSGTSIRFWATLLASTPPFSRATAPTIAYIVWARTTWSPELRSLSGYERQSAREATHTHTHNGRKLTILGDHLITCGSP